MYLAVGALIEILVEMKTGTDTEKLTLPSIDDVPIQSWAKLARKRIFFGHQSVGFNIVDGIADIMKEHGHINLRIVQTHEPAALEQPVFAHSQLGRNTDPFSKIESFKEMMDGGIGEKADIVFFKFCYVDVTRDSQPQKIFNGYRNAIEEFKRRYSDAKFLHVTVPIRSVPKGAKGNLKQFLRSLVGKPGVLDDNMVRERYNKLLSDSYCKTEPFFDLALAESVNPHGFRCHAGKRTEKVHVMAAEYTEDGGHLNGPGSKKVAEQLLIVLAEIANSS